MAHSFFRYGLCVERIGGFTNAIEFEDYTLVDTGPLGSRLVECNLDLLAAQPPECAKPRRFAEQVTGCACQILEHRF